MTQLYGKKLKQLQYELGITYERFTCLGEQFVSILEYIQKILHISGIWYASDVEALTDINTLNYLKDGIPQKIGSTEDLINFAKGVEQFLAGVFVLMPTDRGEKLSDRYYTEDPPFREIKDVLMEIRTFDTSYFLIYSNDLQTLQALSRRFNGKIYTEDKEIS